MKKLTIKNKDKVNRWLFEHREYGCHAIKGATYSDGTPTLREVNVRWVEGRWGGHICAEYFTIWPEFVPQDHREYANGGRNVMSKTMSGFSTIFNQCREHCSPLCCFKTVWPMVKCLSFTAAPTKLNTQCMQGWL